MHCKSIPLLLPFFLLCIYLSLPDVTGLTWNGMTDIDIMLKNSGSDLTIKMRNYGNTFNFPFIR